MWSHKLCIGEVTESCSLSSSQFKYEEYDSDYVVKTHKNTALSKKKHKTKPPQNIAILSSPEKWSTNANNLSINNLIFHTIIIIWIHP